MPSPGVGELLAAAASVLPSSPAMAHPYLQCRSTAGSCPTVPRIAVAW